MGMIKVMVPIYIGALNAWGLAPYQSGKHGQAFFI